MRLQIRRTSFLKSSCLLTLSLVMLLTLMTVNSAVSQDAAAPGSGPLLVLTTGRVITGQITPRPDGYDVVLKAGRMFVPSARVRFQADSLPDAYKLLRASLPELTPNRHVELARWCEENQLYSEAQRELLDALAMDPNRVEAKRMLLSVIQKQQDDGDLYSTGSGNATGIRVTEFPSRSDRQAVSVPARSLGGLTRETAREFVEHVQPLLVNKCAGGCHTAAGPDFAIFSTRQGTTPLTSERNLASVLNHIDLANPQNSRLLLAPMEAHGGEPASVFRGRAGNMQLQVLKNWVQSVAAEIAPSAGQPADPLNTGLTARTSITTETQADPHIAVLFNGTESVARSHTAELDGSVTGDRVTRTSQPHGRELTQAELDQRIMTGVMQLQRTDPFDPNVFNQRYHQSNSQNEHRSGTVP